MSDDGTDWDLVRASWHDWFNDFDAEMWAFFEAHKVSRDTALTLWMLNKLINVIDTDDGDEDWKRNG